MVRKVGQPHSVSVLTTSNPFIPRIVPLLFQKMINVSSFLINRDLLRWKKFSTCLKRMQIWKENPGISAGKKCFFLVEFVGILCHISYKMLFEWRNQLILLRVLPEANTKIEQVRCLCKLYLLPAGLFRRQSFDLNGHPLLKLSQCHFRKFSAGKDRLILRRILKISF